MNKTKYQSGFAHIVVLTIILAVALAGTLGFVFYQNFIQKKDSSNTVNSSNTNNQSSSTTDSQTRTLLAGDFDGSNGEYFGMFQAEGYASISTLNITGDTGECIDSPCKTVQYLTFKISRIENKNLSKLSSDFQGNSFVDDLSVGVGCVSDGIISYYNDSDANGMKLYEINKADSDKIVASTSKNPIILEITKLKNSGGRGAPVCTSIFTDFKLVN